MPAAGRLHPRRPQRLQARAAGPDRHHDDPVAELVQRPVGARDPGGAGHRERDRAVGMRGHRVGRSPAASHQDTGGGRRDGDPARARRPGGAAAGCAVCPASPRGTPECTIQDNCSGKLMRTTIAGTLGTSGRS
jgi:hypothetical protein